MILHPAYFFNNAGAYINVEYHEYDSHIDACSLMNSIYIYIYAAFKKKIIKGITMFIKHKKNKFVHKSF